MSWLLKITTMATFVLAATTLVAKAQSVPLPSAEVVINHNFGNRPAPKWENGFLVAFDSGTEAPPAAYAYDRTGREVVNVPITVPEQNYVTVIAAGASPSGEVAVAGTGGAYAFIAWISNGKIANVVRTSPFAALKLAFAADGTLWALGQEAGAPGKPSSHPILRHYDRDGHLLRAILNRDDIPDNGGHPSVASHLVVLDDRIAFYSSSANKWVEVSPTGPLLGTWKGLGSEKDVEVTGAATTADGQVYVTGYRKSVPRTKPAVYQLNKESNSWVQVDTSLWGKYPGTILGMESNKLILMTGGLAWGLAWVSIQ